jgi:hypothetical protein
MYYRNAAAAVVVYDVTSAVRRGSTIQLDTQTSAQSSLDKAKSWVKELQRQANPNIIIAFGESSSRSSYILTPDAQSATRSTSSKPPPRPGQPQPRPQRTTQRKPRPGPSRRKRTTRRRPRPRRARAPSSRARSRATRPWRTRPRPACSLPRRRPRRARASSTSLPRLVRPGRLSGGEANVGASQEDQLGRFPGCWWTGHCWPGGRSGGEWRGGERSGGARPARRCGCGRQEGRLRLLSCFWSGLYYWTFSAFLPPLPRPL